VAAAADMAVSRPPARGDQSGGHVVARVAGLAISRIPL